MVHPHEAFNDFGDLFDQIFGQTAVQENGADLRLRLSIPIAEALEGTERAITVPRRDICAECAGTGAEEGATREPCETCEGSGRQTTERGAFRFQTTCADCKGRGSIVDASCAPCEGTGGEVSEVELNVQVPGGVVDGHQLRLKGAGSRAAAGDGDLYLVIAIQPDGRFRREGDDVHVTVPLSDADFAAGGVFEVPQWAEECSIELDPGLSPGTERVLDGWGAVRLGKKRVPIPTSDDPYRSVDTRAHRGDLIVTFTLRSPDPEVSPYAPARQHGAHAETRGFLFLLAAGAVVLALFAWWFAS